MQSTILELDSLDPHQKIIQEQIEQSQIDTSEQMNLAKKSSNMIKAEVEKLVASRDEIIKQLYDDRPQEFELFKNITLTLKLRLYEKPAPLTLSFSYLSPAMSKSVMLYTSHTTKEPSQTSNMSSYILSSSPTKITLTGIIDPKTQK